MHWDPWLWIAGVALAAVVGVTLVWRPLRGAVRARRLERAKSGFRVARERLEAKFLDRAAATGRPRGLRWVDCDWEDDVTFARDRHTNQLTAFVGVTVRFEAVEGGPMEGVPAVKNLRNATAMFHYDGAQWGTGGKALFNVNPDEAVARFHDQFELVRARVT